MARPDFIVVMGVSGTGKSEIAGNLAKRLNGEVIEADAYHSPQNVELMRRGEGLTDELRWPWLEAVANVARATSRRPVVIACSALKRSYRELLRERLGNVVFAFLDGAPALIEQRLNERKNHFAGATLLASQLAALEPPAADEHAVRLPIDWSPERIVAHAADFVSG